MEEVKGSNPFRSTKKAFTSRARPKRIILFGSQARGDAAADSDFNIMVVEENPAELEYWREIPGNVYYEAASGVNKRCNPRSTRRKLYAINQPLPSRDREGAVALP